MDKQFSLRSEAGGASPARNTEIPFCSQRQNFCLRILLVTEDEIGPGDGKQDDCCLWSSAFPSLQPMPCNTADEAHMWYPTMQARGSSHGTADGPGCRWPMEDVRAVAASG